MDYGFGSPLMKIIHSKVQTVKFLDGKNTYVGMLFMDRENQLIIYKQGNIEINLAPMPVLKDSRYSVLTGTNNSTKCTLRETKDTITLQVEFLSNLSFTLYNRNKNILNPK